MGEADTLDLLDLGDVSQDLEALSPASCSVAGDKILRTDFSEDSAAEHDYDNISSPGGSTTWSSSAKTIPLIDRNLVAGK